MTPRLQGVSRGQMLEIVMGDGFWWVYGNERTWRDASYLPPSTPAFNETQYLVSLHEYFMFHSRIANAGVLRQGHRQPVVIPVLLESEQISSAVNGPAEPEDQKVHYGSVCCH